jgi:hypothetical protein
MYAPLDRAGQEIKCPDCYSRNTVPTPAGKAVEKKPSGPTLEGAEDFGMSEVVDRPKYRPLIAPRGEYEVLSALDPADVEHRLTVPGEQSARPRHEEPAGSAHPPSPRKRVVVEPVDEEPGPQEDDIALEPPVERSEEARDPRTILPQPDLEPEDPMYDGRYEGGPLGDGVDPKSPDAWKRAPLVIGILGFLFQPPTLLRLIFFGLGLVAVSMGGRWGFALARAGGENQGYALMVLIATIPFGATWLISFAAAIQGVIEATANGDDAVSSWPDFDVFGWFGAARFILAATVVAGLPGTLAGGATLAASMGDPMMAAFGVAAPPVLSWMVLFPMVLYSMLAEDSMLAVYSTDAIRTLKAAADGWVFFYMYSIVLLIVAAFAAAMMVGGNTIVAIAGAMGLVALLILYARLLGRLMWYAGQKGTAYDGGPRSGVRSQRLRAIA